jgi:hypothetical protein
MKQTSFSLKEEAIGGAYKFNVVIRFVPVLDRIILQLIGMGALRLPRSHTELLEAGRQGWTEVVKDKETFPRRRVLEDDGGCSKSVGIDRCDWGLRCASARR